MSSMLSCRVAAMLKVAAITVGSSVAIQHKMDGRSETKLGLNPMLISQSTSCWPSCGNGLSAASQ